MSEHASEALDQPLTPVAGRLPGLLNFVRSHVRYNYFLFGALLATGGVSFWLAYSVRFDLSVPHLYSEQRLWLVLHVALIKSFLFFLLGGHTTSWRYVGLRDGLFLVYYCMICSAILVSLSLVSEFTQLPRGVIVIDCLLTLVFTGIIRVSGRVVRELLPALTRHSGGTNERSTIIIGAGDAGELILREIRRNPGSEFRVMALFDDDPKKRGVSIHGVRVEGGVEDVKSFAEVVPIDTAIVAIPSANGAQMRRINMALRELDLSIKTLPPLLEIMDTSPVLSQLRDLDISDLLGREEIRIDTNQVHDLIHGKVVLVTGAGGSIGGELCCQVLNRGPRRLILLERSENNLFHIHRRLFSECLNLGDTVLLPVLNDVRHFDNLLGILERYRPSVVFHAAAHKHVYMQELNPLECFKNNVGGIQAVARACDQTGVDLCLLISTDKAVGPTSVMGATKRVCEIYCQAYSRISSTKFICVRFGNVLGSEVSVVPIFLEQIASGGPVTVTHPDVTRYFMSIPEAVTLVLQAAVIGKSGQIMLLEMGDPIKIVDLARQLINLAGKNEREIEIQFTGLKPGEKLVEELACSGDVCQETNHNKIKVFQGFIENPRDVIAQIDSCVENAFSRGADFRVRKALLRLVPEYQPAIQVLTSEHAEDRAFTYPDPFHTGASAGLQA